MSKAVKPHKFEIGTPASKPPADRIRGRKQVEVAQIKVASESRVTERVRKKVRKASSPTTLRAQTDMKLARMIAKAARASGEAPADYVLRIMRMAHGSKLVKPSSIERDLGGHPLIQMLDDTQKASDSLRQLVHANWKKQFVALKIERLDKDRHNIKGFECEEEEYTEYMQKRAWKHGVSRMNVTYVAVDDADPKTIRGFATLSMGNVNQEDVDEWARKGLPRFPIPVLHLGQLATDKRYVRQGVAPCLLVYAMQKALSLSEEVGCRALQLKAEKESLVAFYEKNSFVRMKEGRLLMFITVSIIADAFNNPPEANL